MTSDAKKTGVSHSTTLSRRGRPADAELYYRIYEPDALAEAIRRLAGDATGPDDCHADDEAIDSPEDRNRLRCLRRLASDPRGPRRRSVVGTAAMVSRIQSLSPSMPHFAPVIDLVARAALVSARTTTPLRLPPVVMLGAAGCGKTYTASRLAHAINEPTDFSSNGFTLLPCNMMDQFRLRGQNVGWRGARMGLVAEILIASQRSPVVLLDEFDKASAAGLPERPYDIWHSLLERENAMRFRDDFLEIELRADTIIWFASANDVSSVPDTVLDRCLIIDVPQPNHEQLRSILTSLYASCRDSYGGSLPESLSPDVVEELTRHNLRRASRVLQLAVGYAAADGRLKLKVEDIRNAHTLADYTRYPGCRKRIGFVPQRRG